MKKILITVLFLLATMPAFSQLNNAQFIWGRPISPAAPSNGNCLVYTTTGQDRWLPGSCSGSAAFSAITSGTNTGAAMVVGSGASLTFSGSGTINASTINGATVGTATATSGNLLIGSGTAWVTKAVSGAITLDLNGVATLNATQFNALYCQLTGCTMSGPFIAGTSATAAGLVLPPTSLASWVPVGGAVVMDASGRMGYFNGTAAIAHVGIVGSSTAYPTAPTSGRCAFWSTNYNLAQDDADCSFSTDTLTVTNVAASTSLTVAGAAITNNVVQNSKSAAYTTVIADAGKHILHPTADNNARTFTIDSNANVAYPLGAVITFVNQINTVTIAITSDTLVLAGAGTTGSRTLAANGIATAIKIGTTTWMISGSGLT